jgi:hypothetical protein
MRDYGLEWDRVLLTTLGVANGRLYELRLQTAQVRACVRACAPIPLILATDSGRALRVTPALELGTDAHCPALARSRFLCRDGHVGASAHRPACSPAMFVG